MPDAGRSVPDASASMPGAGRSVPDVRCRMLAVRCRRLRRLQRQRRSVQHGVAPASLLRQRRPLRRRDGSFRLRAAHDRAAGRCDAGVSVDGVRVTRTPADTPRLVPRCFGQPH